MRTLTLRILLSGTMHDALRGKTDLLQRMGSSPLFSVWRLVAVLFLAFTASLFDMLFFHVMGVETVAELASQTIIHTIGGYLGFTLVALFNTRL